MAVELQRKCGGVERDVALIREKSFAFARKNVAGRLTAAEDCAVALTAAIAGEKSGGARRAVGVIDVEDRARHAQRLHRIKPRLAVVRDAATDRVILGVRSVRDAGEPAVTRARLAHDFAADRNEIRIDHEVADERVLLNDGVVRAMLELIAVVDEKRARFEVDLRKNRFEELQAFEIFRNAVKNEVALIAVRRRRVIAAGEIEIEVHFDLLVLAELAEKSEIAERGLHAAGEIGKFRAFGVEHIFLIERLHRADGVERDVQLRVF